MWAGRAGRIVDRLLVMLVGDAGSAEPARLDPWGRELCSVVRGRGGEVAILEAVGVAAEGEDLGVVNEPVDHRGGDDVVAEPLATSAERLVASHDHDDRAMGSAALNAPGRRFRDTCAAGCYGSGGSVNPADPRAKGRCESPPPLRDACSLVPTGPRAPMSGRE
jgi:hypothetical protein